MTIADNRFENFTISTKNIFLNFKFIYVFLIPIIVFNIYRCFSIKKSYLSNDFFIFLSLLGLSLSLMFHQLNTKNQLFILFLIPILCAFLHSQVIQIEIKFKKVFTNLLIIVCIFFTIKYHLRYNESRKFHEMANINIELSVNANKRVVIVDTSNEIAGDGDVALTAIGNSRRMQVPSTTMQHQVMIEAVESGPFVDNMLALSAVEVKTCKLKDNNGNVLELLEFISHKNENQDKKENLNVFRRGFTHIALQTTNIEQLINNIERYECKALNKPMNSPNGAARVVYSIGPENILLELVQIL